MTVWSMVRCLLKAALFSTMMIPAIASASDRIDFWPVGAPGFEGQTVRPEIAKDYYVRQIDRPSLTLFRPDPKLANGTAVLILPGGGHRLLVINSEGNDAAQFMADRGVTAFVLRYRLFREDKSPYGMKDARMDTERAMQIIRQDADKYGIDPERIGIMAFSAGGELARMAMYSPLDAFADRPNIRPDFGILVYPGPLKGRTENVTAKSPPLFMVAANDDACCAAPILELLSLYRAVGASAETHLYSDGGHAFNMGKRTRNRALARWSERLEDWLDHRGLLTPPPLSKQKD